MKDIVKDSLAVCMFVLIFVFPSPSFALPAFPGAEGFGSQTPGGRGGKVFLITTLGDSGPGSLRECVEATGARTCIFRIGGTISLTKNLKISEPYLTIAGQTAPGDGILIKGPYNASAVNANSADGSIWIHTNDVIIRGLRIRAVNRTAIGLYAETRGKIHDIIIDHNSFSWSVDSILDNWYNPYNVTYSWNIIAEPVGVHNYGMLLGGTGDGTKPGYGFTVHHNVFAHNGDRNPRISQGVDSVEIVNNVIYNYGSRATRTGSTSVFAGNQYIAGPNSSSGKPIQIESETSYPLQPGDIYVSHNIGQGRTTDTGDDWGIINGPLDYRANVWPFTPSGVLVENVTTLQNKLFSEVGATIPKRDSIDTRILNEIKNKTGGFVSSPDNLIWPTLNSGSPLPDADNDGLPDSWDAEGRNPSDKAPSGYTWIEEYINSFYSQTSAPSPIIPLSPTVPQGKTGDANNDGIVDGRDYVVWFSHFTQTVSGVMNGDYNNNGVVDGLDYVIWLNNYGK